MIHRYTNERILKPRFLSDKLFCVLNKTFLLRIGFGSDRGNKQRMGKLISNYAFYKICSYTMFSDSRELERTMRSLSDTLKGYISVHANTTILLYL